MEPASEQHKNKVLVTGASGQLGQALVKQLVEAKVFEIVGAVPEGDRKVHDLKECGCEVCSCNMDNADSILKALKESKPKQLALIGTAEEDQVKHMKSFIDAAKQAGIEYILLFSTAQADKEVTMWGKQFKIIEHHLKEKYPNNHTIVRSMFHAENFLWYKEQMKEGYLPLPFEKQFAPVCCWDVAEAAMHILRDCQPHHGKVYEITGPEAKDGHTICEDASKAIGRSIKFKKITMEEAEELLKKQGMKEPKVEGIISFYQAVNEGKLNYVSPDFKKLTGKEGKSMAQVFKMYSEVFGGKREE